MRSRSAQLAAALVLTAAWTAAPAADDPPDPLVGAVRDVLHGADAATRERGREALRAQPEEAVVLLLRALEELAAARRPPTAVATVEDAPPAPAEAPDTGAAAVVQLYDVRDLVDRLGSAETVVERIRAVVPEESGVAVHGGGTVVVRTSPLRQEDVAALLGNLRKENAEIVAVETRVVRAPFGAALGRAASAARPGDVVPFGDPGRAVADSIAAGDVEVVTSPLLSCYPDQRAPVQVGREISFVADYDVEVAQSPTSPIADPIIDQVFEGVDVELVPSVPKDGRVLVSVHVTTTQVELEPFRTTLGAFTEPVEIQIPSVFRTELDRAIDAADGAVTVIRIGDDRDARRFLVLCARRERLE